MKTLKLTIELKKDEDLTQIMDAIKSKVGQLVEMHVVGEKGIDTSEIATPLQRPSGIPLKDVVKRLVPHNKCQTVAIIALEKKKEGRETFSPQDMAGWFEMAGLPKPSNMPFVLYDASRRFHYIESKGHSKWTLSQAGKDLVLNLEKQANNK